MQLQKKLVSNQQKKAQPTITEHPFTYEAVNSLRSKSKPLKHMGCELLDNSLDAKADEFHVTILGDEEGKKSKVKEVIIADNGHGMTKDLLEGSFSIGRSTTAQHRVARFKGEHGKYGLGGTMYSLVHFDKKDTITTTDGVVFHKRGYDMENVKDLDRWHSLEQPISDDDMVLWGQYAKKGPGTLIRLTNPRGHRTIKTVRAVSEMKKRFGYRYYADIRRNKIKIFVNGQEVEARCPVMSTNKHVSATSKQIQVGGKVACTVTYYDLANVPDLEGIDGNNMSNAGIYAQREGALVNETPFWFGEKGIPAGEITTKRQNDSRSRIMISFTSEYDHLMGIDNAKDDLEIDHAIGDAIYEFLKPFVQAQRRRANSSAATSTKTLKNVSQKVSKVSSVAAIQPKKGPGSKPGRQYEKTGKFAGREEKLPYVSEVTIEAFGSDPLYRVMPDRQLRINTEHPFYQKYMPDMTEKQLTAMAVLFMTLGATETEARLGTIEDAICKQTQRAVIDYMVKNLDKKLRFSDC